MQLILKKLSKGDMRTTGNSEEVVKEVLQDPNLFCDLFEGLENENPGIRMRSADALEKASKQKPELLIPFKEKLIYIAKKTSQQEVIWHVCQMFTYLPLSINDTEEISKIVSNYYKNTSSNIVKAFSLTTLVHLASLNPSLKSNVKCLLNEAFLSRSPAVKSRAKQLKKLLEI